MKPLLKKDPQITAKFEECLKKEQALLDNQKLLTQEMVQPVQAATEAVITGIPNIDSLKQIRKRKITLTIFASILAILFATFGGIQLYYFLGYGWCELSNDYQGIVFVSGRKSRIGFWVLVNSSRCVIPDGATYIGYEAFRNCDDLTSVTIPDSVEFIDFGAFNHCSSLRSISIPQATQIGCEFPAGCQIIRR